MIEQIKQLMEVKRQAEQIKRELEETTIEVNEISGIKIAINGAQKFQSVEIAESLLNTDNREKLESDLLRSLNAAIAQSQNAAMQRMKDMTGLNIPGLSTKER